MSGRDLKYVILFAIVGFSHSQNLCWDPAIMIP